MKTVLLVDDEPLAVQFGARLLRRNGYDVHEAGSCRAALHAFRTANIDLVITDKILPDCSGEDLAKIVRREAPGVPIIAVTGSGGFDEPGATFDGADFIFRKPLDIKALVSKLSELS